MTPQFGGKKSQRRMVGLNIFWIACVTSCCVIFGFAASVWAQGSAPATASIETKRTAKKTVDPAAAKKSTTKAASSKKSSSAPKSVASAKIPASAVKRKVPPLAAKINAILHEADAAVQAHIG